VGQINPNYVLQEILVINCSDLPIIARKHFEVDFQIKIIIIALSGVQLPQGCVWLRVICAHTGLYMGQFKFLHFCWDTARKRVAFVKNTPQ